MSWQVFKVILKLISIGAMMLLTYYEVLTVITAFIL